MDEEPRDAGPDVAADERTPEQIQADIEATREELGDTVAAVAAKADVKGQAQQKAEEVKQNVRDKRDEFVDKAKTASPETARAGAAQVGTHVQRNPVPAAAAGAFVAGLLIGRALGRRSS
jgi:ElaB/YqjD/DUF883 family membrane-anchored ribosome-binding protein